MDKVTLPRRGIHKLQSLPLTKRIIVLGVWRFVSALSLSELRQLRSGRASELCKAHVCLSSRAVKTSNCEIANEYTTGFPVAHVYTFDSTFHVRDHRGRTRGV